MEPGRHTGESGFDWQLLVPDAHDGVAPIPLVVSLHGGMESASDGDRRMAGVAAEEGFAVVAPDHDRYGACMAWNEHETLDPTPQTPDVVRMVALLEDLGERLYLDLGSYILGCALEDRFAAIAPVKGLAPGPNAPCPLDRPLPSIHVFGSADPYVLFGGGVPDAFLDMPQPLTGEPYREAPIFKADALDTDLSVPERVAGTAVRNGYEPQPLIGPVGSAERYVWPCPDGANVELVTDGGGHVWPTTTDGRSTGKLVWGFFEQHPMPE